MDISRTVLPVDALTVQVKKNNKYKMCVKNHLQIIWEYIFFNKLLQGGLFCPGY